MRHDSRREISREVVVEGDLLADVAQGNATTFRVVRKDLTIDGQTETTFFVESRSPDAMGLPAWIGIAEPKSPRQADAWRFLCNLTNAYMMSADATSRLQPRVRALETIAEAAEFGDDNGACQHCYLTSEDGAQGKPHEPGCPYVLVNAPKLQEPALEGEELIEARADYEARADHEAPLQQLSMREATDMAARDWARSELRRREAMEAGRPVKDEPQA